MTAPSLSPPLSASLSPPLSASVSRRRAAALGALALFLALGACAGPTPPPPTTVALSLTGAPEMNGGFPVQAKVFYLRSPAALETADFFAVFQQPEATLGADLIAAETHLLAPGETLTAAQSFDDAPAAIGVVAGFREIDGPGWQAVAPLAPQAANVVAVTIGADAVAIGQ